MTANNEQDRCISNPSTKVMKSLAACDSLLSGIGFGLLPEELSLTSRKDFSIRNCDNENRSKPRRTSLIFPDGNDLNSPTLMPGILNSYQIRLFRHRSKSASARP